MSVMSERCYKSPLGNSARSLVWRAVSALFLDVLMPLFELFVLPWPGWVEEGYSAIRLVSFKVDHMNH